MTTLTQQKQELINQMVNTQGLNKQEKLKAILQNTGTSVKLDQIASLERKVQNIREYLFELAAEKGISKHLFRRKNSESLMMDDLELIELHKQNKLETIFKF